MFDLRKIYIVHQFQSQVLSHKLKWCHLRHFEESRIYRLSASLIVFHHFLPKLCRTPCVRNND